MVQEKRGLNRGLLSILGMLLAVPSLALGQPQIKWITDLDRAVSSSKQQGKPLLLSFTDAYEKWCFSLDFYTYCEPQVVQIVEQAFIPARVEKGKDSRLVKEFSIQRYPSTLFLDPSGQEIERCEQFLPPDQFLVLLKAVLEGTDTYQYWKARVAENPKDAEACFRLAEKYLARNRCDLAASLYQQAIDLDPAGQIPVTQECQLGLAFALGQSGKHDKALKALTEFCEQHQGSPLVAKADFSIGLTYFFDGKNSKAEEKWRAVARDYPDTVWGKKALIMAEEMKRGRESPDESNYNVTWENDFMEPEDLLNQTQKPFNSPEPGKKKKKK